MIVTAIPLIRLFGNLIVSIQVSLTDSLIERLIGDITLAIEQTQVSGLILDLSGVDMLDSHLTYRLRTLAVAARLMGVDTVVCGMRPAVVMTIVEMGLDLVGVSIALNLERALELLVNRAPEHTARAAAQEGRLEFTEANLLSERPAPSLD
jgi:rsbT antagonist protein RsbS